ncbi:MAG: DUF3040 domain-containing protein [Mycetocola reblochoni]|uniref:Membrane protein n=2 Tax=Mycetocola reblochoni TaxID=331618 RepID=A0A1R4J6Z0_9MICO|nr:DUF3040 domain-containing protein [Mycetocola reblochoni]RLP69633.1 DUF3040 domain-containing protein [Mycetocola reblochoni]SJN27827.1 Membrane protein [Mycetocola reblochoni REB411]
MPLSEQEQRLLNEMERNFYSSDADVVSPMGSGRGRPSYRNIVIGALIVLVGIGGLIAGVGLSSPIIGIVAFVLMLGGVLFAITPSKSSSSTPAQSEKPRAAARAASSATFMDRMNDRWDRRNER